MGLPDERKHVMFAGGIQFNIFYEDHLLVLLVEYCRADYRLSVLGIALGQELERLGHPLRSLEQAFPPRVFPEEPQYFLHMYRNLIDRLLVVMFFSNISHI